MLLIKLGAKQNQHTGEGVGSGVVGAGVGEYVTGERVGSGVMGAGVGRDVTGDGVGISVGNGVIGAGLGAGVRGRVTISVGDMVFSVPASVAVACNVTRMAI